MHQGKGEACLAKNQKISFTIGANIQAGFTAAFKFATETIDKAKTVNENYQKNVIALNKAFDDGIIKADSYKRALSVGSLGKITTEFAKATMHAEGFSRSMGAFNTVISPFKNAVKVAASFEQAMDKVGAITNASEEDMKKLTAQAKELGAATQFSARQSAEAMSYLGMAGWQTQQILAGMPGMLDLAAAGGTDLARTADIVSDNLTAFGLGAEKATHMANVYATVITSTNTNVEMLGDTMKYAAPVAHAFGASMEETAAIAGLMANSGIKASQAGTAMRAGFLRLAGPPKMAADAMKQLGLSMEDITAEQKEAAMAMASLKISMSDTNGPKKMSAILTELREKIGSIENKDEKLAAMKAIFGTEAATGWLAVMESGQAEFDKLMTKIEEADKNNAAANMAKHMQDNAVGAMVRYQSAVESLNIAVGEAFLPALTACADGLASVVGWMAENETVANFAVGIGILGSTLTGVTALIFGAKTFVDALRIATVAYNTAVGFMRASTTAATVATQTWNTVKLIGTGILKADVLQYTLAIGKMAFMRTLTIASTATTWALTAAQWAWNVALSANPIGLTILAVGALIAAGVALYQNWDTVKSFFVELWDNPTAALNEFVDGVKSKFTSAFDWVHEKWDGIRNFLSTPIFGQVNIAAQGALEANKVAQNAYGGIYGKGAFLTTFAEKSGESAIPHTPTPRNIGLLAETNRIMGNPLNVNPNNNNNANNNNNVTNNNSSTTNNNSSTTNNNDSVAYNNSSTNNINSYYQNTYQQSMPVTKNIGLLAETNRIQEKRADSTVNITFSPNITVQGSTNTEQIDNILSQKMREFEAMLTELQRKNRRLSYA